jgi:hypothetical protein
MRVPPPDLPDVLRIEREIRSACMPVVVRSNGAPSWAMVRRQAVLERAPGANAAIARDQGPTLHYGKRRVAFLIEIGTLLLGSGLADRSRIVTELVQ